MFMFVKYDDGATPLKLAKPTDVGYDLAALEDTLIRPGRNMVKTGVHAIIPNNCKGSVDPRSGNSAKGMPGVHEYIADRLRELSRFDADVLHGTIDPGYTGDIMVIIKSNEPIGFVIPKGTRIAQLVIDRIERLDIEEVEELPETERGNSGFNSTGVQ